MPPGQRAVEGGERGPIGLALSYLRGGGWVSLPYSLPNSQQLNSTATPDKAPRSTTLTLGASSQSWAWALREQSYKCDLKKIFFILIFIYSSALHAPWGAQDQESHAPRK